MLKKDIAKIVASNTSYTQDDVLTIIDKALEVVSEAMVNGDKIQFNGFGSFKPVTRAARVARNPQTGETINVPSKKSYKFEVSDVLKKRIEG